MVPFVVVVLGIVIHEPSQVRLPERDRSTQTFLSERAYETLRVGVQVGNLRREPERLNSLVPEQPSEGIGEQRVAIVDE